MVGEGGYFLFSMYPVLKLEICPVACKRKQIIFKEKNQKNKKYYWCHYSILSIYGEMQSKNSSSLKFLLGTPPKRKEMKKYFWIQRFVHWISLKNVSMCANRPVISPVYSHARCCLFIPRLTCVCTENGPSRPIVLGSNVNGVISAF